MLKKHRIAIVCIPILLVLGASFFIYYTNVKKHKLALYDRAQRYQTMMEDELAWLGEGQLSNGTLPFRPQTDDTAGGTSYFSDFAALALLQDSALIFPT